MDSTPIMISRAGSGPAVHAIKRTLLYRCGSGVTSTTALAVSVKVLTRMKHSMITG